MSFSIVAKDELARLTGNNKCCKLAELAALIKTLGSVKIAKDHQVTLSIVTDSAALARKNFLLLKHLFQINANVIVQRRKRLHKNSYVVTASTQSDIIIDILKCLNKSNINDRPREGIPWEITQRDCCRRAYLRGVFLGNGSVNNPVSNNHLEMITANKHYARDICRLLQKFHLHPGLIARKNNYVVYLKDGEQIAFCLNIMGAHTALLKLENIRVYKDMRNQVNRLVNCETANLSKTINASLHQLETIRFIASAVGIEKLSLPLRQVARARLDYPDVSLRELGELLDPKIGKSGVKYRLEKLEEIAEEYKVNGLLQTNLKI